MRKFSKSALTAAIIVASFVSVAMTNTSTLFESVATLFGRTHLSVGDASLTALPSGSLLVTPLTANASGVEIPLSEIRDGNQTTLNVIFDPVKIEIGDSFAKELISSSGHVLATFRYDQVTEFETEVYMILSEAVSDLESVRVATYADGAMTSEAFVPANLETKIGTVNSVNQAWMKTYHWTCDYWGCDLMTDPANTTIRFAANPDVNVPFVYLSFGFGNNDMIRDAASVRLTGTSPFTIVDENNDPLNLIY